MMSDERGLALVGLDGSNPLGFLAAVGLLRTITLADEHGDWRMQWTMRNGWLPVVLGKKPIVQAQLVEMLHEELRRESCPEFTFAADLNVVPKEFGAVASSAQSYASARDRRYADFIAAFGSEIVVAGNDKTIQDTALRTMSGAGHQHFLRSMKDLVDHTGADKLLKSLFEPWDYSDLRLGLRWDPVEDRRHALRWDNPSGTAPKTMYGANRLAMEALPLLPTAPFNRRLATTGFSTRERTTLFTWPIWDCRLSLDVVRSLLAVSEIQKPIPDRALLGAMGISEVYRSQRITVGKYRNFTHSRPA